MKLATIVLLAFSGFFYSKPSTVQYDGPTIESWFDSLKIDSSRYMSKIDSVILRTTRDSALGAYLDDCYWHYHSKKHKVDLEKQAEWFFEPKRHICQDLWKLQLQIANVTEFDSLCSNCFLITVLPFNRSTWFVELNSKNELVYTELYSGDNLICLPRKRIVANLEYLEKAKIEALIAKIRRYPKDPETMGLDGTSITIQGYNSGKKYEIGRWCFREDLKELKVWLKNRLQIEFDDC